MYTLDTNIVIYYAAGDLTVNDFLNLHRYDIFYLPSIVAVEFLSFPSITDDVVNKFRNFVGQTILLNLDFLIAERAAEIRKKYRLGLADAVVAASALMTDSTLITRNVKDFKKIPNLRIRSL